jgi:transcriptional antiterminator RfaH
MTTISAKSIDSKELFDNNQTLAKGEEWLALYVKSRHEKKVAAQMTKFGYPYYLPMIKVLKTWSDRRKWIYEPLFRGYVFVPNNTISIEHMLNLPGVVGFVRYDGKKALIPRQELKGIADFIKKGYHIEQVDIEEIGPGDKVEILFGPFKGSIGTIIRKGNKKELIVEFQRIEQAFKVLLSTELMKKLKPIES